MSQWHLKGEPSIYQGAVVVVHCSGLCFKCSTNEVAMPYGIGIAVAIRRLENYVGEFVS